MKNLRIGVIIPDRNDRPEFLANCFRMLQSQKVKPDVVRIVNYAPLSDECDITPRYRQGYEYFNENEPVDVIFLIENDDYYHPEYIETMLSEWQKHGKPDIFGTNYTIYYHIGILAMDKFNHLRRASAMNTMLKSGLEIKWPADNDPYTDLHLWKQLKGVVIDPGKIISIGIKHGISKTGGQYHSTKLERYKTKDPEMEWLRENTDELSFNFYKSLHEKIQSNCK